MKKRDFLLCLVSAVLLVLSFPKYNLEPLAWFALVPLLCALEGKSLLQGFVLGFVTGFLSFVGIIYWIVIAVNTYGNVPFVLSVLILLLLVGYLSLFFGTFAFITRYLLQRFGSHVIMLTPFLWVSLEYLRSFLLTGFPWANLGHSQYLNLPFIQVAEITGVYGLSFVILLVNVTFYRILRQWSRKVFPIREVIITLLIFVGCLAYGYVRMGALDRKTSARPPLDIGLVQGNIDQSIKWDESFQRKTLEIYERLSLDVAKKKPGLIIWPETATPFFFQAAKEYQPFILDIPKKTAAFLLFGTPSFKLERGKVEHYNSAYLVSPAGEISGRYDKIHLVPFGEYVPLSDLLFFIGSLGEGIGNFKSGKEFTLLRLSEGQFGVLICFEIIFPDLSRRFVRNGADFLVTITNDAWFGTSSAPYQHLAIATFRAVENRVFVARAANTGISAFIDPKGRIVQQGKLFEEEALNGTIRLMKERTFYTLYGDVFAWVCSAFTIVLLGFAFAQNRRR
jgi:apolipoprotein N-acyltransferase